MQALICKQEILNQLPVVEQVLRETLYYLHNEIALFRGESYISSKTIQI